MGLVKVADGGGAVEARGGEELRLRDGGDLVEAPAHLRLGIVEVRAERDGGAHRAQAGPSSPGAAGAPSRCLRLRRRRRFFFGPASSATRIPSRSSAFASWKRSHPLATPCRALAETARTAEE